MELSKAPFALALVFLLSACGSKPPPAPAPKELTDAQCKELTDKSFRPIAENASPEQAKTLAQGAYDECVAGKPWVNNKKYYDCIMSAGDAMAIAQCGIVNSTQIHDPNALK